MKIILFILTLLFSLKAWSEMIICQIIEPTFVYENMQIKDGDFDYYEINDREKSIKKYKQFNTFDRSKEPEFNYYNSEIPKKIPRYVKTDRRELSSKIPTIYHFGNHEIIFSFNTVEEKLLTNQKIEDEAEELAEKGIFRFNPYPNHHFVYELDRLTGMMVITGTLFDDDGNYLMEDTMRYKTQCYGRNFIEIKSLQNPTIPKSYD